MNFSNLDLNLLRVLDALLSTRSTTEAGRRIGLSQPAVSAALSRLRHALNDPLLIRQGRGLTLTDYAATLRDPLRDLLDQTETLLAGPDAFDPNLSKDSFRLSGSDFYAELLMPQLANHLTQHAPNMRLQMIDMVVDQSVERLDQFGIDLAIVPMLSVPEWVESCPLHSSRFVVIARQDHPQFGTHVLPALSVAPLDPFCQADHVMFSSKGDETGIGDEALARIGRRRNVMMTLPVFSGVCTAVANSDLIALVPEQIATHMAGRTKLTILSPPIETPLIQIVMIWHRRSTRSPAHRWLRNLIVDLMRDSA